MTVLKSLSLNLSPLIFVSCLLAIPKVGLAQSLQQAVEIALQQYPTIVAAQARINAADSDIIRAQGQHWPQVSWQGTNSTYSGVTSFVSPNDVWIQSPSVTMNIWAGGRIQADVDRSRAVSDTRRQQQRITRDEVASLAIEGYLVWARAIELLQLATENLKAHERIRADVAKIVQVDQGRRIDLDQASARVQNANLALQQRRAEHAIAEQRLSRMLLGKIPPAPSGIEKPVGTLPKDSDAALSFINETHPVIAQALSQVKAAQASVRSAQSQYSPTVNFSYGKQVTQGTGQGDYVAQLTLNVPIFSGGSTYGAVGSAQSELVATEQSVIESRLTVRERLLSAWSDYLVSRERVTVGKSQINTARQVVKGYEQQFRIGRRSLFDLLNVQNDLYGYQSSLTMAVFDEKISHSRILASMGQLALAYQKLSYLPEAKPQSPLPMASNIK